MEININIKQPILNEINRENMKKNITEIDLAHLPFSKFTVIIQQIIDYNKALEIIKREQTAKLGTIDIFDCMTKASKLVEKFKNENQIIKYNVTEDTIFISSIDYEIKIPNTKILKMTNNSNPSDIKIISDILIDEINSLPSELEKRKFLNDVCIEALAILLCVITIFNDRKNKYLHTEKEHRELKSKPKTKKKKANNVTYVNHKTITIHKSQNTHSSGRSYERQIDTWVQRGHWRHYKNGKRVWIKETVKNAKDKSSSDNIKKTYEII